MGMDTRQVAYNVLVSLAGKQGYVTFDDIMDCADDHALPIQDFDWLSNSITSRGILVYNDVPSAIATSDEDEYDDFAQCDYDAVYKRTIELSPSLEPFVSYVKAIIPPQRQEIKQLKYQIVDGNEYAKTRMIEMHLRIALRVALQRAELYDMDIEDAVGYACIGLILAVDKYDPDTSGAFSSYATLWILQNISREQSTRRPLIYYPAHQKEAFFIMYPILKGHGCIKCNELQACEKALHLVSDKLGCNNTEARKVIAQMIPDVRIEELIEVSSDDNDRPEHRDSVVGALLGSISSETILSHDDSLRVVQDNICRDVVNEVLHTLTEREEEILKMRYGFYGSEQTLEQVGTAYGLTRERVRQIEVKALNKLRHPSRAKVLRDFID